MKKHRRRALKKDFETTNPGLSGPRAALICKSCD